MSEETNKRVGDYQILNELGSGGMGRVYRVRNVISDRIEAMKVLLPDLAGRQELATRFLREIKLMASLNHPNIAGLRTAFTAENQLVMIMEYVEGTTLAERLEHGPIPTAEAVNYIDQVLSALSYAHQQHVIHRDIKPANMMLTPQGVVKLMDFGIARAGDEHTLTMTGTTLGSLGYMSPEQVKGEPIDARSDLYSVGVSLYEMVTGQRPFRADSDYSIMAAHVKEAPKSPLELQPGLPAALDEIILMAIAKDPAQRFQTADAFRNALSSVQSAASVAQAAAQSASEDATAEMTVPMAAVAAPSPASRKPQAPAPARTPADVKVATVPKTPSIPTPPPPAASGHRGLYMTLGALLVLAVLVVAGIYIPRRSRTEAKSSTSQAASSETNSTAPNSQPASSEANSTAPNSQGQAQPAAPAVPAPDAATPNSVEQQAPPAVAPNAEPTHTTRHKPAPSASPDLSPPVAPGISNAAEKAAAPLPPADAGANSAEAASNALSPDALEREIDQLSDRAVAVNSSLDRLQQQQSSAGYGLRGDMAAKQASMKNNLAKAQSAIERGDLPRAKKYADLAQSDVEALEHFLGH